MSFETWFLFILAVLALMSSPGPSHLLKKIQLFGLIE